MEFTSNRIPLNRPFPETSRNGMEMWTGEIDFMVDRSSELRTVLLAEIVARVIKCLIRQYLRTHAQQSKVSGSLVTPKAH
jgi:hypothetical protein